MRLTRLDNSLQPGYRVEEDGEHVGDVFKTDHPIHPSVAVWYGYLPGAEFPLDPSYTRREQVESLVLEYRLTNELDKEAVSPLD